MKNPSRPELITIDDQNFGSHVEHWSLLTDQPTTEVPKWLGLALDQPVMPMGLCTQEADMDPAVWFIQGPNHSAVQLCQVIAVENNRPKAVKTAFPCFESPYKLNAQVERIICSSSNTQAVLRLKVGQNATIYAFDSLYSVNHDQYQQGQTYQAQLSAWAYELESVAEGEQIVVDDPASVRYHHALNDILAEHQGVAPDNLQELLDTWQPKSEADTLPVTVDFSKMVAYLYGETLGQEDEAWFQGKIVGKTAMRFMDQEYTLYDVTLILEENQPATLIRIATKNESYRNFSIGQYIRGNIWIQAHIHSKIV